MYGRVNLKLCIIYDAAPFIVTRGGEKDGIGRRRWLFRENESRSFHRASFLLVVTP
jgi:hypothetical protein